MIQFWTQAEAGGFGDTAIFGHSQSCASNKHLLAKLASICSWYPTLGEQILVGPSIPRKIYYQCIPNCKDGKYNFVMNGILFEKKVK